MSIVRGARALIRAVAAIVALAAMLLGVPWFLARFADPRPLLTTNWGAALTGAADAELMLALLGLAAWLAWAFLTVAFALELVTLLSRRRLRLRLPGTGWLRPMLGALLLAAAATPTVVASADTPAPTVPSEPVASPSAPDDAAQVTTPTRTHVVQPGEELWDIAAAELGSGDRWREVLTLNPHLTETSTPEPGTRLVLPEVADGAPAALSAETRIVVQEGDTLWDIAERTLGDPLRWPEIHDLNRDEIADPDEIDVGWVLRLPGPAAGAPSPAEPEPDDPADTTPITADRAALPDDPPADVDTATTPWTPPAPPTSATDQVEEEALALDADDPAGQVAAIGAALAAVVLGGVATRRHAQLLGRAAGRRLVPVPDRVARFWTALARRSDQDSAAPARGISPTAVVLGWDDSGGQVLLDLAEQRATRFAGPHADALVGAVVTGLTCAPWAADVDIVLVGDTDWAAAVDDPRIGAVAAGHDGVARLTRLCSERRLALRSRSLADVLADPDTSGAWAPVVFVFGRPLTGTQPDAVADALALGEVGVHVITVGERPLPGAVGATVEVGEDRASWNGRDFEPQLVPTAARRALIDLFSATGSAITLPAPWSGGSPLSPTAQPLTEEEPAMTAQPSSPEHPMVLLLGDVDITAAAGLPPSRARTSCVEYCAWLLAHPSARATVMADELMVAESTRRSNMSRLRSWLGADVDGAPYLPDAYSGRISLDPRVSSDWEQFQALLSGGVRAARDSTLRAALRLVRGEPLGSAAFQWPWAETQRADMVAMIVDAAATLADRAIDRGDHELALWATRRGRLASPLDDEVAVREIHALALAGRMDDVQRAVLALNRQIRAAGRDLSPALARRVQQALHLEPAESLF